MENNTAVVVAQFLGPNANGVSPQSPGLRGTSYPGLARAERRTPKVFRPSVVNRHSGRNRVAVLIMCRPKPRVARSSQLWAEGRSTFGVESLKVEIHHRKHTLLQHFGNVLLRNARTARAQSFGLNNCNSVIEQGDPASKRRTPPRARPAERGSRRLRKH